MDGRPRWNHQYGEAYILQCSSKTVTVECADIVLADLRFASALPQHHLEMGNRRPSSESHENTERAGVT